MKFQSINFVLAHNEMGSITRLIKEYASELAGRGYRVIVSFPVVSHWHYHIWAARRPGNPGGLLKFWVYVIKSWVKSIFRSWVAKERMETHSKIVLNRFFCIPRDSNMPSADVILTLQEYLVPAMQQLKGVKGRVISSIRTDYSKAITAPAPEGEWWMKVVRQAEKFNVPRFANSQAGFDSAAALNIRVDGIVPNGINLDEFFDGARRGDVKPVIVALYCDGNRPGKGAREGCEVVARLRDDLGSMKDVRFYCFGPAGSLFEREPRLAEPFDKMFGFLAPAAMADFYRNTDILIFPSFYEGFSHVLLEAMASGCAVASTRVSGVTEYGVHMENCMIASPGDIDAMAKNVKILIHDVLLRDRLRENGLAVAQRYSWKASTDSLVSFIENIGMEAERCH